MATLLADWEDAPAAFCTRTTKVVVARTAALREWERRAGLTGMTIGPPSCAGKSVPPDRGSRRSVGRFPAER